MSERRMFSKAVIGSGRFLLLPHAVRLLYYDLGMYADDDGIVEAYTVMRQTGAREEDLKMLVEKGFVEVLNDDLVTRICDWKVNNRIRQDRYRPGIYREYLSRADHGPAADLQKGDSQPSAGGKVFESREPSHGQPADHQPAPGRQPS